MNAAEAMETNPTTLKPDDTIECAAKYIMKHRYRNLPVINDDSCYMGMFGVNCLLKLVIPKAVFMPQGLENVGFIHESFEELYQRYYEVKDKPISICMNNEIEPVAPDTPLTEIMLQLYETRSSIPVVQPGSCKLMGMISYWEIGKKILRAGAQKNA
jgi:CBS-domain-containing membrane protein